MDLFDTLDDLKPYIFRIVDNGGATCDRFTIITCDGDYYGASTNPFDPQGFGMWGEGIDVQHVADRVESGEERDLRWIDLPERVRRAILSSLNTAFADFIEAQAVAETREGAGVYDGCWCPNEGGKLPIYRDGDAFRVRDDDRAYIQEPDESFATYREAVLYILPDDYCLSGPEYHTTVDIWDETGGPAPLWDCEAESEKDDEAED